MHNIVTCVLDHVSATINLCSFAVQSVFCGDTTTGNISEPIRVMFKGILNIRLFNTISIKITDYCIFISVLEPPLNVIVPSRYSYSTGNAIGFVVEFTALVTMHLIDNVIVNIKFTHFRLHFPSLMGLMVLLSHTP